MKPANPRILTINGGSSSIKFALFEAGDSLRRILEGRIERIGLPEATLLLKGSAQADNFSRPVSASDQTCGVRRIHGLDRGTQRTGCISTHRVLSGLRLPLRSLESRQPETFQTRLSNEAVGFDRRSRV